ncbi:hypothetical protein KW429_11295 [Vibrio fluvialis]|nr:hypothetical protein [Vibrio fluvialis]MBY7902442.1 hypothetical protein [Vibrio fluvialis]
MAEKDFDYGDWYFSYEEKPIHNDRKNPFGEFYSGFRKVRLSSNGKGYIKACGANFSRCGLEQHVGRWVYVVVDNYFAQSAVIGTDIFNPNTRKRTTGVVCKTLKIG